MKTCRILLGAITLFVLGTMPQIARAQVLDFCVATYTDFIVDMTEGEVVGWAWAGDYFSDGYCYQVAYGEWGYWEHTYEASVEITSPTQNSAFDEDYAPDVPFGGGWAHASTSLSIEGDPGWFHIEWCVNIWCTIGNLFLDLCEDDDFDVPPIPIVVNLTFDDGPTSDAVENYSQRVIVALATNSVQPLAPATFFVQTHVSNRGGHPGGIATMEMALDAEHAIQIHTGSDGDHALHTVRIGELPYPPWGGSNGLESDLIRAKDRIDELDDGSVPELVRPPEGVYNSAVLNTYADPDVSLECVYWNVDSGDTAPAPVTVESIKTHLEDDILAALNVPQTRQLVVLFHDVKSITSDNLGEYLQKIKSVVEDAGYSLAFMPLPEQAFQCD